LKPGAFKLRVNWIQLVQPHQARAAAVEDVDRGVARPRLQVVDAQRYVAVQVDFQSKL
jgi:hypothetical protein